MAPEHVGGGDEESLVGAVDAAEGGSEGDHVEVGIFFHEESALQSGVDGAHQWFLAEELLVLLHGDGKHLAVGIGFPARVALPHLGLGTCQTEHGADGMADVEVRLEILAGLEAKILMTYDYIPMLQNASMALLSKQVYYVVEEYNVIMGRGGIAYMKYNYNEAEWAEYVAANKGEDGLPY